MKAKWPVLFFLAAGLAVVVFLAVNGGVLRAGPENLVTVLRTPDAGIQPQAVRDARGVLHVVYYKGDPKAGDIFYIRRAPQDENFSEPLRVNSREGSAIAIGTIRGAQMAVGRNGRVHVAWNGSSRAPKAVDGGMPMLYARLNDAGTAFEPERNLITWAGGLDGGGSVAADAAGNVYVAWHGSDPENKQGEAGRRVFVAVSRDEGKTFAREEPVSPSEWGACACCGMKALAVGKTLLVSYRAAKADVDRDMLLLTIDTSGDVLQRTAVTPMEGWKVNACPMSSTSLFTSGGGATLAAWETQGQVSWATLRGNPENLSRPVPAPGGTGKRRFPSVVRNRRGETLLVWTEGTGWNQGGRLAWQVYDANGKPAAERGQRDGVPVWSLPTAYLRPAGDGFLIMY